MEHFSFNRDIPGKSHPIMIKRVTSSKARQFGIQTQNTENKNQIESGRTISTITVKSLNRLLKS